MGNLRSVESALSYLGVASKISSDPSEISLSSKIILPGVGSFNQAMNNIHQMNLYEAICEAVLIKKVPLLGICIGMQLLAESGEENGNIDGFGFIEGNIARFSEQIVEKIPHVGFNSVKIINTNSLLFKRLSSNLDFYFVHSYRLAASNKSFVCGICEYGEKFVAAVECDNIFAVQFHPEKSQSTGLQVLLNFSKV
jgi:glutamine amidotransferase